MSDFSSVRQSGSIRRSVLAVGAFGLIPVAAIGLTYLAATEVRDHDPAPADNSAHLVPADVSADIKASSESNSNNTLEQQNLDNGSPDGSNVTVHVNGENIPVPDSGNLNKTIQTPDGQVDLNIQNIGGNENTDKASSSVNVHINSDTNGSNNSNTDTRTRIRIRER